MRPRSATTPSWARTRAWWRRSRSGPRHMSARDPPSPRTCRRARSSSIGRRPASSRGGASAVRRSAPRRKRRKADMCGIVGYVGDKSAVGIIVDGLKKLEYRGYDSAGVAILQDGTLQVRRAAGKMKNLEAVLRDRPVAGSMGIGHTRWATHGRPSEENAHPHTDCSGGLVVVHNGILENYVQLKERLQAEGHVFKSETDTEVLAHLIEAHLAASGDLEHAVRRALGEVRGAYAVGVVSAAAPDRLIAGKHGAGSVVVGLGQDEMIIASDIPAILAHTRDVVILEDGEMAVVTARRGDVSTLEGQPVEREPVRILWDPIMAEKGGYRQDR